MKDQNAHPPKRRGRPRKHGESYNGSREHIIASAIQLFEERGYAKTSLSEIARQSGLDQSSIYYYFPSKEAILKSVLDLRNFPSFALEIDKFTDSPILQLYMLIVGDVVNKCELPFDSFELENLAHENPQDFEVVFEGYHAMYQAMIAAIERGEKTGDFMVPRTADECVLTILCINDGLQHHYHAKQRNKLILESAGYKVKGHSPEEVGLMAAVATMPSITRGPVDFEALSKESSRIIREFRPF